MSGILHKDLTGADLHVPGVHTHVKADITDFPVLIPGTGNGDVVGPVVATPGNVATFADDSGKVVQDGGAIPTTLPASDVSAWAKEATKPSYSPAELGAEEVANKSVSVPTDAVSDVKYPSVKAVKDYADGLVAGLLDYRGAYDAAGNAYPTTGGSGTAGAVMKGDMWAISVAGILGGVAIQVGDAIIAKIDTPAQTAGNWNTLNTNVSYVPENQANKENTTLDTSTVKYPSNAIVKAALATKVTGPVSSVADHMATFVDTTGEFVRDGGAVPTLATLGTAAYSEGTWTPVLHGFTIVGAAPTTSGAYKKIGKLVFVTCAINAGTGGNTSIAAPSGAYITGFATGSRPNTDLSICSVCSAGSGALIGGGLTTSGALDPQFAVQTASVVVTATYNGE